MQAESRVENRCSANTPPRPERVSLLVAFAARPHLTSSLGVLPTLISFGVVQHLIYALNSLVRSSVLSFLCIITSPASLISGVLLVRALSVFVTNFAKSSLRSRRVVLIQALNVWANLVHSLMMHLHSEHFPGVRNRNHVCCQESDFFAWLHKLHSAISLNLNECGSFNFLPPCIHIRSIRLAPQVRASPPWASVLRASGHAGQRAKTTYPPTSCPQPPWKHLRHSRQSVIRRTLQQQMRDLVLNLADELLILFDQGSSSLRRCCRLLHLWQYRSAGCASQCLSRTGLHTSHSDSL